MNGQNLMESNYVRSLKRTEIFKKGISNGGCPALIFWPPRTSKPRQNILAHEVAKIYDGAPLEIQSHDHKEFTNK
jgi:hypothetical protein